MPRYLYVKTTTRNSNFGFQKQLLHYPILTSGGEYNYLGRLYIVVYFFPNRVYYLLPKFTSSGVRRCTGEPSESHTVAVTAAAFTIAVAQEVLRLDVQYSMCIAAAPPKIARSNAHQQYFHITDYSTTTFQPKPFPSGPFSYSDLPTYTYLYSVIFLNFNNTT